MKLSRIALFAAPLLASACTTLPAPTALPPAAQVYPTGMVSAADPRAAEAGAEMLRRGGSATDAAIATMLALTVVEPQSSGIGGGGLFVSSNARGEVDTIDGRETAPAAATPNWFMQGGQPIGFANAVPGGLSVGVPGNIALVAQAHRAHGRLPWAVLFEPAIKLARDGFAITPRLNAMLAGNTRTGAFDPAGQALFYSADGTALPVGTVVRTPDLAATLSVIATQGAPAFYSGANARAIAARVSTAPRGAAPMTAADVEAYQAKPRAPLCANYRQYRICGMGPPSSGATTVLATLGQLERFDLTALGKDSPVAWHLIAESERLAYADRARYSADPDFVAVPATGMVDRAYLTARGAALDPARTMPSVSAGTPPGADRTALADPVPAEEHGTSAFIAVDRAGNAVSYTSTIESSFGSGLMVGGYYLNNELTDFDMQPQLDGRMVANRVEGGKRPRSSMSPTLVFGPDGHLVLAVGAAGGATIPAQVIRAVIGMIDWHLQPADALALPVIVPLGDALFVEQGSALEAMIPALQALGHSQIQPRGLPLKANAILITPAGLVGAADPRSEGRAIGE